ncbi:MAG: RecX family transcriptional regulator [Alphaproteobacteria bacterium]
MDQPRQSVPETGRQRRVSRVSPAYLERAALYYLERFASSADNLRRLLMRRVGRSVITHGTNPDEAAAWVEALIVKLRGLGYLDDGRFAETKAVSLNRRGRPLAVIRSALRAGGVGGDDVDQAIKALTGRVADPDLAAAAALVRRKRLGPCRAPETRAGLRSRDLAALGRAGFSYDLARRVVDAPTPEDLERMAKGSDAE